MTSQSTSTGNLLLSRHTFFALMILIVAHISTGTAVAVEKENVTRILFVGNSLTRHGPMQKIGWTNDWGMAASAAKKDYVHLVVDALTKSQGQKPEFRTANGGEFELDFGGFDPAAKLKEQIAFKADIVIVAIGENVPRLNTKEEKAKFRESVEVLLRFLKQDGKSELYVRSCFWPDATKDTLLKEACVAAGGVFVDISDLAKDESNYARSEQKFTHKGVAAHPGDKGMREIADAIIAAIKKSKRNFICYDRTYHKYSRSESFTLARRAYRRNN